MVLYNPTEPFILRVENTQDFCKVMWHKSTPC